ncbi:MAG: hypothetical protein KDA42_19075 [Planctomycetales bacterium]|nr:hypothetical protein [Planctomycetales bacterium]
MVDRSIAICQMQDWPCAVLSVNVRGLHLEQLRTIVFEHGIPFVEAPVKRERPDLYFKVDGHWNAQGHQHIAQVLWRTLEVAPPFAPEQTNAASTETSISAAP